MKLMEITCTMIQKLNHIYTHKLQVNYYHIQFYYPYSISKIQCHYTPISQLYYIAVMEPSTKVPIIDLDESEEETEEEREFSTT